MKLRKVATADVVITDALERLIVDAAERSGGTMPASYIVEAVCSGQQHLWTATEGDQLQAMAVTMICRLGQMPGLCCVITAAAGFAVDEWLHFIEGIEQWARERGCVRMVIYGRRGWVRKLAPMNYSEASTVLVKTLSGE